MFKHWFHPPIILSSPKVKQPWMQERGYISKNIDRTRKSYHNSLYKRGMRLEALGRSKNWPLPISHYHIRVYIYIHMRMYIYICTYTYMYMNIQTYLYVYVYIYMYICICTYVYTYTYIYVYIYTYIYIYTYSPSCFVDTLIKVILLHAHCGLSHCQFYIPDRIIWSRTSGGRRITNVGSTVAWSVARWGSGGNDSKTTRQSNMARGKS